MHILVISICLSSSISKGVGLGRWRGGSGGFIEIAGFASTDGVVALIDPIQLPVACDSCSVNLGLSILDY
jgi:hypothetical protein